MLIRLLLRNTLCIVRKKEYRGKFCLHGNKKFFNDDISYRMSNKSKNASKQLVGCDL
jgi:hypothetical protein